MTHIFPELPVLERIIEEAGSNALGDIAVVGVQHLLDTTGSLVEACVRLGVSPERIFLLGKCYSSCPDVIADLETLGANVWPGPLPSVHGHYGETMRSAVKGLWERSFETLDFSKTSRIIVLDDGGQCFATVPKEQLKGRTTVVGVEQTTSGIKASAGLAFPLIDVASSAAKRKLEPSMIASAVAVRISEEVAAVIDRPIGVIGYGNIGRAVADLFISAGREVIVFDVRDGLDVEGTGASVARCVYELLAATDVVFGCTGVDVLPDIGKLSAITGSKCLISCSSGDVEFNTILRLAREVPGLDDKGKIPKVHVNLDHGLECEVIRGGFPANFDRGIESVPAVDIQLTRGLLLGAILQAAALPTTIAKTIALEADFQHIVASAWAEEKGREDTVVTLFNDLAWIRAESEVWAAR